MKKFIKKFLGKDELPQGGFECPKYELRRDSHNGYHFHVLVRKSGRYVQSNYAITVVGGVAMGFFHKSSQGNGVHFDESSFKSKQFLRDVQNDIKLGARQIEASEWRKFKGTKLIPLFHI